MGRRKSISAKEVMALLVLAAIGLPIVAVVEFGNAVGWLPLAFVVIFITCLVSWLKARQRQKLRDALMQKYRDYRIVDNIMNGCIWQGQTIPQLIDSIGRPVSVDQKVLKTKKKEIWKYHYQGANRFGLRIILENDIVIGWEQKS
jgi:hypothetical protein